jgi:hypothetical protein
MTTMDFITALFCQVDNQMAGLPKHPDARLWSSEVVTLGLLHARKGVGNRGFSRWLTRDYRVLFPHLTLAPSHSAPRDGRLLLCQCRPTLPPSDFHSEYPV